MPNSFKMTIFGQHRMHRMQDEGGAFNTQDFSQIYFYLPSTVDRNEKINKYMTSVNLKPFAINHTEFGDQFNPADLDFDRSVMVELMKKVALQSSQNLKRNADVFLSTVTHDNDKLLWSGGKGTQNEKYALMY